MFPGMMCSLDAGVYLSRFGVPAFRPGQREAIERVLAGKSVLALMPTGAGKSLCYQLPAVALPGTALVVSPLLALMKDQVDSMLGCGVSAARWDSTLTGEERELVRERVDAGALDLLYVAPESLQTVEGSGFFASRKWSFLVVDEAHCLSAWGQSFRPEYLFLPRFAKERDIPVLALTATATERVVRELETAFGIDFGDVVRLPLRKENIVRKALAVSPEEKEGALVSHLSEAGHLPAIVYVHRREDAETVSSALNARGIAARAYHAGMSAEVRAELQESYLGDEIPVLVATTAFGMGVDKPNVRSVVHYHVPSSLESYLQESGRGGRDGESACSLVLADADDLLPLRNRFKAFLPSAYALESFLRGLLPRGGSATILYSPWNASTTYDFSESVLGRVMAWLEEEGYLTRAGEGFLKWKLRPLVSPAQMAAGRGEEERLWLEWLSGKKEVTLEEAAEFLHKDYAEAGVLLEELEWSGEWLVVPRHRIRLFAPGRPVESYGRMAAELAALFESRLEDELTRLDSVVAFFASPECYNRSLEQYFGESPRPACGVCTACVSGGIVWNEPSPEPEMTVEDASFIRELADARHPALRTPRQVARFLAGFLSPSASFARLWKSPHYGAYPAFSLETLEQYAASAL